jgi:hypothetical protein
MHHGTGPQRSPDSSRRHLIAEFTAVRRVERDALRASGAPLPIPRGERSPPTPGACAEAARLAGSDLEDVNEDIHASEAYRRAMIPVFTRRALDGALVRLTAQS